jgi:hypothetical protein
MKQNRLTPELKKELKALNEERMLNEKNIEKYKKNFSEELKNINPQEIKNTVFVEEKYTLWRRLKKVLGIN